MNFCFKTFILSTLLCLSSSVQAQEVKRMSISEALDHALNNHPQLAVSQKKIDVSRQYTEVAKLQKLPSLTASTSQFYLGNSVVFDKNLSNAMSVELPHYGSSYGLQASQLIFRGGALNKSIEIAQLQEQLSELDYENDALGVKFLVMSNFLDLHKIDNQKEVYLNNKKLAEQRLKNTQKFYQQGMITRNEVIRNELAISNINQGLLVLESNRNIINYNLNNALGLPSATVIVPTDNFNLDRALRDVNYYIQLAHTENPREKTLRTNIEISQKNIDITKTELLPTVGAFGGYSLNRPMTSTSPVRDLYSGGFQLGVSVNYNIDNLYKTKERVQLGKLQKEQAEASYRLVEQNVDMEINAAYNRQQTALENLQLLEQAKILANENYKIIEAKYLNQLAVQADMTDAQNQKIQSELDYANAQIDVLYQYYTLLKATGTL